MSLDRTSKVEPRIFFESSVVKPRGLPTPSRPRSKSVSQKRNNTLLTERLSERSSSLVLFHDGDTTWGPSPPYPHSQPTPFPGHILKFLETWRKSAYTLERDFLCHGNPPQVKISTRNAAEQEKQNERVKSKRKRRMQRRSAHSGWTRSGGNGWASRITGVTSSAVSGFRSQFWSSLDYKQAAGGR
ncbi:uncharacterized protein L3040_000276 [Drepanopeziza brunnea f. sp. 'multigermtubi']|uniref:uncharacterized protein n=1 Tax=Drepanopeziza brunnea f. sp. 'multigermtubi' TaxID=698441 RepID=UPI002394A223|nr:hypothetical protein L3040_000276 [Drepanopeziza brunnea f. sp. 'multigermtubi']